MSRHNRNERLRYEAVNEGEVDSALDLMEHHLRTLSGFATAVQNDAYPHDPEEDLCNGIVAVLDDWIRFRRELPALIAGAVQDGTIIGLRSGTPALGS